MEAEPGNYRCPSKVRRKADARRCFRNGAAAHLNRAARYRDGVDGLVEVEADGGVGSDVDGRIWRREGDDGGRCVVDRGAGGETVGERLHRNGGSVGHVAVHGNFVCRTGNETAGWRDVDDLAAADHGASRGQVGCGAPLIESHRARTPVARDSAGLQRLIELHLDHGVQRHIRGIGNGLTTCATGAVLASAPAIVKVSAKLEKLFP